MKPKKRSGSIFGIFKKKDNIDVSNKQESLTQRFEKTPERESKKKFESPSSLQDQEKVDNLLTRIELL